MAEYGVGDGFLASKLISIFEFLGKRLRRVIVAAPAVMVDPNLMGRMMLSTSEKYLRW